MAQWESCLIKYGESGIVWQEEFVPVDNGEGLIVNNGESKNPGSYEDITLQSVIGNVCCITI